MSNIPNQETHTPIVDPPSKNWGNLKRRVISALIMLPICLAALWIGGLPFGIFVGLVSAIMAYEWHTLVGSTLKTPAFVIHLVTVLLAVVNMLFGNIASAFLLIGLGAALAAFAEAFQGRRSFWIGVGVVYTIGAPILLIWLRQDSVIGFVGLLALVCAVVATDVGAYFAGKSIGGPKLVPSISPSKTWAGLIGGGLLAAFVSAGSAAMIEGVTVWLGVAAGFAIAVVSQIGDIIESSFKRHFDAKDSSQLIPGHGGVLDRFDGLMFAGLVVALGTIVFRGLTTWM